jgi:hypothetical protein
MVIVIAPKQVATQYPHVDDYRYLSKKIGPPDNHGNSEQFPDLHRVLKSSSPLQSNSTIDYGVLEAPYHLALQTDHYVLVLASPLLALLLRQNNPTRYQLDGHH